ncbi:MAG: diphthine--ammonia ligase [Bacteroidetes bacterium]|nr:diphthine--ammonia ligase [Bacteroidota bacterium]
MTQQAHILCSWSGGKDSCFALMQSIQQGCRPQVLLNVLNEEGRISRSHGIPADILQAQAAAMQLPIHLISSSWQEYEAKFVSALQQLTRSYTLTHAVFGDIDLQAHRDWEENVCAQAGLTALLPLWQQNRKELVYQMLDSGIETMIVSCNTIMGERFLGKMLTPGLVAELEALGVDVCGENGEFHTLVLNCPLFNKALKVLAGKRLLHNGYWFTELSLA